MLKNEMTMLGREQMCPTPTIDQCIRRSAPVVVVLSLVFILVATLYPYHLHLQVAGIGQLVQVFWQFVSGPSNQSDIFRNLYLFAPLGFGLASLAQRWHLRFAPELLLTLGGSAALSFCVEMLQLCCLALRFAALVDVLANSLGGLLGLVVVRVLQLWGRSVDTLAVGLLAYLLLAVLTTLGMQGATRPSNWAAEFPLALGNEPSGDRPWAGYVRDLTFVQRALNAAEVAATARDAGPFAGEGVIASYWLEGHGPYVDHYGLLPDLHWQGNTPLPADPERVLLDAERWLQTNGPALGLAQQVRDSGQFSLITTVAPLDLQQAGPARIVTFSADSGRRNITLGQDGAALVLRLRTPLTGQNGVPPELRIPNIFTDTHPRHLVVSYDGATLLVYVDGVRQVQALALTPEPLLFHYLLPVAGFDLVPATALATVCYKVLYYSLLGIPLGLLLALRGVGKRGVMHWRLTGGGLLIPALALEGLVVALSGRELRLENLVLSISISGVALLFFALRLRTCVRPVV